VSSTIYLEGGGDSREGQIRCREGFRKLLERCSYKKRMPRLVADRDTLAEHYGADLQTSALPSLHNLEGRARDTIQNALIHATRSCGNAYTKGKRSFEVLAKLDAATLSQHLPSFARVRRILDACL
jgi:hypothetical protein